MSSLAAKRKAEDASTEGEPVTLRKPDHERVAKVARLCHALTRAVNVSADPAPCLPPAPTLAKPSDASYRLFCTWSLTRRAQEPDIVVGVAAGGMISQVQAERALKGGEVIRSSPALGRCDDDLAAVLLARLLETVEADPHLSDLVAGKITTNQYVRARRRPSPNATLMPRAPAAAPRVRGGAEGARVPHSARAGGPLRGQPHAYEECPRSERHADLPLRVLADGQRRPSGELGGRRADGRDDRHPRGAPRRRPRRRRPAQL